MGAICGGTRATHCPIHDAAYGGVRRAPDFAGRGDYRDPYEVVLLAVVNNANGEAVAPVRDGQRDRWIELGEHVMWLSVGESRLNAGNL